MKKKLHLVFVGVMVAALLGMALPSPSHALSIVTTRAGIGQNDFTDWGQLGAAYTMVPSGSTATSNLGLLATFSQPGNGNFERRDQGYVGPPIDGWAGNFASGDHVLWNQDNSNTITLQFSAGLFAVGTQLDTDAFGAFTGTITAYGSLNNLLGTFSLNGNANSAGDNSAIFLGVSDTTADIFKVVYTTNATLNGGFGINQLAMRGSAVPIPGAAWLLGSGLLGLVGWRRFRKG